MAESAFRQSGPSRLRRVRAVVIAVVLLVGLACAAYVGFRYLRLHDANVSLSGRYAELSSRYSDLQAERDDLSWREKKRQWAGYQSNGQYARRMEGFRSVAGSVDADIVFLGDSLTEMWPVEHLFSEAAVMNQGISGDVSDGVMARLDTVEAVHPRCVVLMIGTNDLAHGRGKDELASNVDAVCSELVGGGVLRASVERSSFGWAERGFGARGKPRV